MSDHAGIGRSNKRVLEITKDSGPVGVLRSTERRLEQKLRDIANVVQEQEQLLEKAVLSIGAIRMSVVPVPIKNLHLELI